MDTLTVSQLQSIPGRAGFLKARDKGEKALARGLLIQAVVSGSSDWRIGLTASKKIGNAVCRNRARRRMRALARLHLSPIAKPGIDYVLIARHDTIQCAWPVLVNGLIKAVGYLHHKLPGQSLAQAPAAPQ